jgi:hypothetical protein
MRVVLLPGDEDVSEPNRGQRVSPQPRPGDEEKEPPGERESAPRQAACGYPVPAYEGAPFVPLPARDAKHDASGNTSAIDDKCSDAREDDGQRSYAWTSFHPAS